MAHWRRNVVFVKDRRKHNLMFHKSIYLFSTGKVVLSKVDAIFDIVSWSYIKENLLHRLFDRKMPPPLETFQNIHSFGRAQPYLTCICVMISHFWFSVQLVNVYYKRTTYLSFFLHPHILRPENFTLKSA